MHLRPILPARCAANAKHQLCTDDTIQRKILFSLNPLHIIFRGVLVPIVPSRGINGIGSLQICIQVKRFLEQCQGMLPPPSNSALQILGCPMRLLGRNAALMGLQIEASTLQSGGSPVGGNGIDIWDTAAALKHDLHRCSIITTLMSHWLHSVFIMSNGTCVSAGEMAVNCTIPRQDCSREN